MRESRPVSHSAIALAELTLLPRPARIRQAHIEPVSTGIPFARGVLRDPSAILLHAHDGSPIPAQATVLARWPDHTVRWALVDALVPVAASDPARLTLVALASAPPGGETPLRVEATRTEYVVHTGAAVFRVPRDAFVPFAEARMSGAARPFVLGAEWLAADGRSLPLALRIERLEVETPGPVRLTLKSAGLLQDARGRSFAEVEARTSFYAGTGLVRLDLVVRNPRPARHRDGLWDLGDAGSVYFESLALAVRLRSGPERTVVWSIAPGGETASTTETVEIYQDSSGGENWMSRNHVNRHGVVPNTFRGCRIRIGPRIEHASRALPVVSVTGGGEQLSAAVPRFWQEFPKAITAGPDGVRVDLFPSQFADLHELQGGEQKTHTVFLECGPEEQPGAPADLGWVHSPVVPCLPPHYHTEAGTFAYFTPAEDDPHGDYLELIGNIIEGDRSFFAKREVVDEYGWRHFGEVYADHENTHARGERPIVSHFNNQYDLVYGELLHFARSGDPRWFELAADLARHVIDIDLYHTSGDRPAYNGGYFWHTDHYLDAGRSTHRTYTRDSEPFRPRRAYGGGPANEHNYTTGLLYYYYFSGDPTAREALVQIAEWVIAMDDGRRSPLGLLDEGPTGLASRTREDGYHGPGRGSAHSVNALLDAWSLTGSREYLVKAEELIRRVIHPRDPFEALGLGDLEGRWSYVVFLQVLGKYLDTKVEQDERDSMFSYARASLVHYARWMLEHERPLVARLAEVEFPTETWPAQDIRKSCVFDLAARYGPPELRRAFLDRAAFFFEESLRGLASFATRTTTRPLAIVLGNGAQRAAFAADPPASEPLDEAACDFGNPTRFLSQRERVKRLLRTPRGLFRLAVLCLRPRFVLGLIRRRSS